MSTPERFAEHEIDRIESELRRKPQLAEAQVEEVRATYDRIRSCCKAGKHDEVRRARALCLSVIRQGAPVPE